MKKEIFVFFPLAALALVIGYFYDYKIAEFLADNKTPLLTSVMQFISFVGNAIGILMLLSLLFLLLKKRKPIAYLWISMAITLLIVYGIKAIVLRPRPFEVLATFDSSFPSSHTASAFVSLPILIKYLNKYKLIWIILALLVAFSRMYLGMHYLTDVASGAILGYTVSFVILHIKLKNGNRK